MSVLEAPVLLELMPELAGILLSPEEFDAVEECDELYNYELVHGVLIVAPPPAVGERAPNDQLGHLLRSYKEQHPQGDALDLTLPEHLIRTPDSRRRADRVIWTGLGRLPGDDGLGKIATDNLSDHLVCVLQRRVVVPR